MKKRNHSTLSSLVYLFAIGICISHIIFEFTALFLLIEICNIEASYLRDLNAYIIISSSLCILMNFMYAFLGFLINKIKSDSIRLQYCKEYIKIPLTYSIYLIFYDFLLSMIFLLINNVNDAWVVEIVVFTCSIFILIAPSYTNYRKAHEFIKTFKEE